MTDVATSIPPRAFVVWFRDLWQWDVLSLRLAMTNRCGWPTQQLHGKAKSPIAFTKTIFSRCE